MSKNLLLKQMILIINILFMMRLNSQVENLIKTSKPYSKVKPTSKNLIFKDRFGNEYLPNELPKILKQQPTSGINTPAANGLTIVHSCTIGHFNIQFVQDDVNYGFDSIQYRNVICEVFKDLDRLLYKQNTFPPYVLVIVTSDSTLSTAVTGASLPPGVDIMGTSFEPVKYKQSNNWQDNMMYRSIKWGYSGYERMMGSNGFHPFYNYAHGLLTVNFKNKTWYKNFKDTMLIPTNQDDLYTHTLHQVLHMLGINASINEIGNTTIGNSLYARYTNFLYKNNSSNKLFTYSNITKKINKTSTYNLSCNAPNNIIFLGTNATNISVYNDTPFTKNINLSHFGCTGTGICNPTYAKPTNISVLVPCLGGGMNYIKRHPSQEEVFALCDLGYKLKLKNGVYAYGADTTNNKSQGDVYTTYSSCTETCVAIGGHDTIMMDTIRPITLSFAGIVGNDVPNTSIVKRVELPDTTDGVLTITPTGFTFTPKPNFRFGEITIIYYPQCDTSAVLGSATYITLLYPYPPLSPCVPNDDCNYICYGTFEESNNVLLWGNFNVYQSITPNTPDLYNSNGNVTCYRNNVEDYWHGCNEDDGGCVIEPGNLYPHITGGRQFVGLFLDIDPYSEGLYFKLKKPIYHDPTKRFRLKYLSRLRRNNCVDFKVIVAGDDTKPDTIPQSIFSYIGPTKICNKFCDTIGRDTIKNDTWNYYDIPITQPKLGDSFTYIIVYGEPNIPLISEPGYFQEYYALFDNFELYDSIDVKVLINSSPNNITPCQDTTHSIDYFVCLDKPVGLNSDSILIHVNLPTGFSIAAGSDFNSSGICKIPANTISNTICDTLKLNYNINYSILDYNVGYDIITGYNSPAYCKDEETNIVRIFPQNKAVTIQKTVSKLNPTIGDTVTFNLQLCNQSKDEITDIVLTDTIPAGLKILDYAGFSLMNNIITKDISIDSAIAGVATCNAYQYKCIVESDCKISNKVYLKSLTNVCFKANSTVILNAASSGTAVYGFITPTNAIWCGNPLTLTANVVNPSGTYTYQWQYNSTNIAGATSSSYTATLNGIYGVNISQNGCGSKIISRSFDSSFTITKQIIKPNCTTNNGSITMTPINGIKPYTYSWSGSTNTSNSRTGLIAGTYIVTITDSIGCSKIDTIVLSAILDTPKISKQVSNKICITNGKISITPTYGKAPFHYIWNDLDTNSNRIGLNKGTYKVTITDSLGCQLKDSMMIDSSQNTILANDSIIDNYCTNNTNGKIYLRPSGGAKPYQYLWNNGAITQDRIGLVSANYIVTITDSVGCSLIDTFTIDSMSSTIKSNDSIVHAYCSNNIGQINLNPSGGTKPYSFLWSNGDTTKNRSNLNAGSYYVTITDLNNCIKIDSFQINNLNSNIVLFNYVDQPVCNKTGNIYVTVLSGGFAPFKYHWSNNKDTSFVFGVLPGSYSLTVIDNLGCSVVETYIVDTPISLIKLNPIITNTQCNVNNGAIKLNVSGGVPPYTYTWKNSSNTSDSMHNLSQGYYVLTVTDNTGCSVVDSFYVPLTPILLDAYLMGGCNINNITDVKVHISDGEAPYTYIWNTGSTDSFVNGVNTITYPSLFVTITDKNGCSVVVSKLVSASAGSISIGTGTAFPTSSSMKGVLTFGNKPAVSNQKFIINGTFLVDESSGFDNCDFEANPGSKIIVTDSLYPNNIYNYTTFSGCHFYTCGNQLWKGIELKHQMGTDPGGLIIWSSLIEDALYGVDVFSGPITGYDFVSKNCFIGLLNRDHVGTTCWRKMTFFGSGTGSIKQPYANISNSFYSTTHDTIYRLAKKSFCGIEYNNTTYAFTRDVHKFYNLTNGLVLNDVFSAHIDQSYFENMQPNGILGYATLPNGLPYFLSNGAAIILNNSSLASGGTAYIRGIDVNTSLIKNCKWGVIGNSGGFIDMANMKIDSCNYGVFLNYSSGLIQMNAINATSYGIRQELTNTPNIYAYIDNNIINTSNIGIGVYGNTSTSRPYFGNITGNSIYFKNSGTYGVDAMNINNIYVFQNYIEADMPGVISVGYNYENCINVQDEQNTFYATSGNRLKIRSAPSGMLPPYPIGYYYYFTEHMAKCNSADNVRTGVRYTGLCNNSQLIGTSFHNHDIGLKLDNTATLIDQVNNGNAFLDTCNFEARSDQPVTSLTQFFVNPSSSSALWASPRHPTTPSDIFQISSGVDNTDCNIPLPPQAPEAELRDKIRLALLQYDEFEPQMLWQNQSWLYDYLAHRDSLTDEETEFLTAMQGHNIEKLDRLTDDERAIFDRALSTKEQIQALTNNLNINANLLAQYSQVNTDALDSAAYSQHRALIASAQTTFNQQSELLNNLLALESSQNYLELDTLSTANGQIVPEFVTDSLEVVFNALYYNTYARNNYNLSAEELMSYRSIANQCPMLNANAVFRSRAIVQSQSDSTRFYDDAAICLAAGYEYKNQTYTKPVLKPKPKLDYQLFPNPAKNYTKILFAEIPIGNVKIEVFDVLGRSIISDKLELNSNYYELNTMILNSGIYMIKISINNQDLAPTKLKIEK